MSFIEYLNNKLFLDKHKNIRAIEHLHPDGKEFPHNTVFYHKGGYLSECNKNNNFTNCFEESTSIYSFDGIILEGISKEQFGNKDYNGGMILFAVDVNSVPMSNNKIINFIKQKAETLKNSLTKNKKLTDLVFKHNTGKGKDIEGGNIGAFSIGNFFKGRYVDTDSRKVFNEKSTSIEILGIPSDALIALAEEIAKKFKQQTVMVKDYNTGKNYLVDQN